jgi:hypothetical protein
MKFAHLSSRLAVGGVAAALATAGLVGVTSTSASAAPVSTTYTCTTPLGGADVPVSVDIALLPSTAPAGFPVPAGLLSFKSTITVPPAVAGALTTVDGAKSDDFSTSFGSATAKAPVVWNGAVVTNGDGSKTISGTGANGAFQLPAAGSYAVNMPKQFTLIPTSGGAPFPVTPTCTSAAPTKIGDIVLSKQASKVKAKAPKSAKKGAVVSVKGKVTNEYVKTGGPEATGKLIIKDGKKKVGKGKLKNGKFTIKVKGLAVGSHKLVVTYKGDDFTDKGKSKAIKVKVTK